MCEDPILFIKFHPPIVIFTSKPKIQSIRSIELTKIITLMDRKLRDEFIKSNPQIQICGLGRCTNPNLSITSTPRTFTKKTSISHKLAKHTNIIKHPQTLQPPLHTPRWQKEYVVKSTNVTGLTRQGRVAFLVKLKTIVN
jgi:hypothetical protein